MDTTSENNRKHDIRGWIILAAIAIIIALALAMSATSCTTGSDGQVCNSLGAGKPSTSQYKAYERQHQTPDERITREANETTTPSEASLNAVAAREQRESSEDTAAEAEQP